MINPSAFLVAVSFLSRIPIPARYQPSEYTPALRTLAVLWYPAVGLLLGLLLAGFAHLLPEFLSPFLRAVVLLVLWVVLTGGLHLDGFADSIDAAFASHHKNTARVLEIFKEPQLGAMAATCLILLLLLKVGLIAALVEVGSSGYTGMIVAAVLSRLLAVHYMYNTPYARLTGLAQEVDLQPFGFAIALMTLGFAFLTFLVYGIWPCLLIFGALVLWYAYWRSFWNVRIGGYTGDCVGALIEVAEVLVLFGIVLVG